MSYINWNQFNIQSTEMKPFSEACEQNKQPILAVLQQHFANVHTVLEIGSGTGQHAVFFAAQLPHLRWLTSEVAELHAGIKVVVAESIERIYGENCQNLGLLTTTDFSIIDRIRSGESIALSEFTAGKDAGVFTLNGIRIGINICEDVWRPGPVAA